MLLRPVDWQSSFLFELLRFQNRNLWCTFQLLRWNTKLKLAKNEAKAKQHPETELLLFENYSLFSSTLSSKTKCKKQVRLF